MKKKTNILLNIIIVVLLGVMAFSGYKLLGIGQDAKENNEQYEKLEQIVQDDEDDFDSSWDRFTKILASIIVEDMIANLGG